MDEWLDGRFSAVLTPPSSEEHRALVQQPASAGRIGAVAYDALVALTALIAGAVLVTADTRAAPDYELVGVEVRFLEEVRA